MPAAPLVPTLDGADIPRVLDELARRDPALGRLIRRVGPFGLEPEYRVEPYRRLVRSIVYQQLSGRAAGTILRRVMALYGDGRVPRPEELLATPEARLRAAGLSRNKLLALRDLAARTLDGTVPSGTRARRMTDDALIEHLSAVRGVGRWTVEMLLIGMGRPDVLPVGDLGIRKGYAITVRRSGLPAPETIRRRGQRWRPWRTVASWYLWRAVDGAG